MEAPRIDEALYVQPEAVLLLGKRFSNTHSARPHAPPRDVTRAEISARISAPDLGSASLRAVRDMGAIQVRAAARTLQGPELASTALVRGGRRAAGEGCSHGHLAGCFVLMRVIMAFVEAVVIYRGYSYNAVHRTETRTGAYRP